jgi:hypothetical protein
MPPVDKHAHAPEKVFASKRKRGVFADEELVAFTNIVVAVKDIARAIRDNKPTNMHRDIYATIMDIVGFTEEALMAILSHLFDHKAQGTNFVGTVQA